MEEINQQLASQVSANSPQIAQNELISQGNSQNPNQNAQIQQINNQSIMNNRRRSDFQNNQSHSRSSNNSDSNNNTFVSGNNNSIIANQNSFMQRSGMKQRIDLTPAQIDISSSRDHPRQHHQKSIKMKNLSTENHQYHTINNQNDRDDRPLRLPDRSENANLSDQQIFRNQPRQTDEELKQPSDFQLNLGQQQAVQNQSVVQELSEEEYEDEKQEYQRYQMKQAMEFNGFRDEMSEDSSFIMEDSEQYKNQYYYLNRTDRDEFEEKMQNSTFKFNVYQGG